MKISSDSTDPSDTLLICDLAGTLIRPDPPVARQYREVALAETGSPWVPTEGLIEERFRTAFKHVRLPRQKLRYGTTRTEGLWFWKRVAGSVFPRLDDGDLARVTQVLFEQFERASAWAVYPGARRVLRKLTREEVTVALLSNWDARGPELLWNLQLSDLFEVSVFSSEVGYEKPDSRIFDEVLNRLGKSFKQIGMIGNHVEIDLEIPDRRGWETVLFCPGSDDSWKREVSGWDEVPDWVFDQY